MSPNKSKYGGEKGSDSELVSIGRGCRGGGSFCLLTRYMSLVTTKMGNTLRDKYEVPTAVKTMEAHL